MAMLEETYEQYRERKRRELKRADEATGGEICKRMGDVVKAQAELVQELLRSLDRKNLTALRTELERLVDYQDYAERCG